MAETAVMNQGLQRSVGKRVTWRVITLGCIQYSAGNGRHGADQLWKSGGGVAVNANETRDA